MSDYLTDLGGATLYGLVGIALLAVGYLVLDLLTPGHLGKHITDRRHHAAGLIAAAGMIAVGAIVATAIASSDGNLGEGLAESAGYGAVGIVLMGMAYLVVDLLTPGKLGDIVMEEGEQPAAWMLAAALVATGAIVAASIS